ncbi:MAG: sulfotransferase family protein [Cyclobacteriaceae bacterium]
MKEMAKVFVLGMGKTGTSSLDKALQLLGYKVAGYELAFNDALFKGEVDSMMNYLQNYDAAQDLPWAVLYKELFQHYPDAKFILTVRDANAWIKSYITHYNNNSFRYYAKGQDKWRRAIEDMNSYCYGAKIPKEQPEVFISSFVKHNDEVMKFFSDKPEKLLIMDLSKDGNWSTLCTFLDQPIPRGIPFPHTNSGSYTLSLKLRRKAGGWIAQNLGSKVYNTIKKIYAKSI